MVSITLSVPEEIKHKMEEFPEMNWSGFIRKTIIEKTQELSWKEQMLTKLKNEQPRQEWAVRLQRASRASRVKQLRSKGLV